VDLRERLLLAFSAASVSSNTQQSKFRLTNRERSALPTAGFESLLIIAKREPVAMGNSVLSSSQRG